MNDYYSYNKQLNTKKVIIASIILVIIGLIALLLSSKNDNKTTNSNNTIPPSPNNAVTIKKEDKEKNKTNILYEDEQKTISVELKRAYNLQSVKPQDNRLLVLKSEDNLSLYITKLNLISNREFLDIVTADKDSYITKIGPYSNLTEIRELQVGSLRAYTYGLHFLDQASNSAYLLQIVWLEAPDGYYIFDVEYPLDDNIYYQSVLTETLSTFTINSLIQR